MMSYPRLGRPGYKTLASLVALGIALLSAATVQAAPQYEYKCDACHRMPPLDSGTGSREAESGAVKGNHESHSGPDAASCVKCHGSELTSAGHRDKRIQVTGNINSSAGARYERMGFFNQTTLPPNPLGTCSSVNCHFEAPSPAWGTKSYQTPAACNDCHLLILDSGNHRKHTSYYGSDVDSCGKCHPDHAKESLPFRHATSAASRGIAVSFSVPRSGGTYSGDGLNFLPSQQKTTFGACSAVYCHTNGANGAPNVPAVWGGSSLPADCSGCHGANANAGNPAHVIGTGAHAKHINNAAPGSGTNLGTNYACARCHKETMEAGSDLVVANRDNHINGNPNVVFSEGGGYGGGVCSSTMCHGPGKASAPSAPAPSWGGGALDCKGCHGYGSSYGEPNYPNAGGGLELANSHGPKHVTGPASCANCHPGTTADGLSIVNGSTTHTDGYLTVSFPSGIDLGGASYNGAPDAKTCSGTYCHSDGAGGPALEATKWGGTTNCRSCHGGDAASGSPVTTHLHPAHLKNYSTLGRGNAMMCAECHAKTVGFGNNTTLTNPAAHLNGYREYSSVRGGGKANYSGWVCSNVYCHSSGEAVPVFRNMTTSKAWNGGARLGCDGCHGYGPGEFTPVAGEPHYPSSYGGENSHQKHTVGANMADSRGCAVCHRTTIDAGVKNKLKDYSSAHLNGVRDVTFAVMANYSGRYDAAAKSCSNTYCHGAGASDPWGTPGPLSCSRCHGANVTLPGAHGAHWQDSNPSTSYTAAPGNLGGSATSYRFECSSCHNGSHAQGPLPTGYAAEVFFNYTTKNLPGRYDYGGATRVDGTLKWSDGSCLNTYCHSKGDGSEGYGSLAMNWASPEKTLRCNGCHGGAYGNGRSNPIDTNLHKKHLDDASNPSLGTGNGLRCGACHALTVGFGNDTTLTDKRRHVNKFRDYSGLLAGGSGSYDQRNKTCNTIYCHSNGKRGTQVNEFKAPGAWTSPGSMGCDGCHGSAAAYEFAPDGMGTPNYRGGAEGSDTANSHRVHIQKMPGSGTNVCYVCHARTVDKYADRRFRPYSSTHLTDGATHVAFGNISTVGFKLTNPEVARYAGKTCSTVTCHSNGKGVYQDVKWGATGNCTMCHPLDQLSRGHIFHVDAAAEAPTFYDNYTANRSSAARYNYGCGNCHPLNNPGHTKGTVLIDMMKGSSGVVGTLRSRNGAGITVGNVTAGTSGSGTSWSDGDLVCNNVYCHSNGYLPSNGSLVYAVTPGWYNGSFSGDRCAACHGNAPNSGGIAGSASHYNGSWMGTLNNNGGHIIGIHSGNIVNDVNFTGLLTPGTSDPSSHGRTPTVTPTTMSCNTCHYSVITTSANSRSAQCVSCHGSSPMTNALAEISNKSLHVNGNVSVQFRPTPLFSKAQLKDPSFAAISSALIMKRFNGYKAATSYDASKIDLSAGSYAGGSCTTVCHLNNPVRWDNTPAAVTCSSCHSTL